MNIPAGLGAEAIVLTPMISWVLVFGIVAVVIALGIGIETFLAAGRPAPLPVHAVTPCGISGHRYRMQLSGWRCTNCGEGASYQDEPDDGATSVPASAPRAA